LTGYKLRQLKKESMTTKFKGWLWAVRLLLIAGNKCKPTLKLDPKGWEQYYEDGLTPSQAITEDFKHV
jgi:hypothetical protein